MYTQRTRTPTETEHRSLAGKIEIAPMLKRAALMVVWSAFAISLPYAFATTPAGGSTFMVWVWTFAVACAALGPIVLAVVVAKKHWIKGPILAEITEVEATWDAAAVARWLTDGESNAVLLRVEPRAFWILSATHLGLTGGEATLPSRGIGVVLPSTKMGVITLSGDRIPLRALPATVRPEWLVQRLGTIVKLDEMQPRLRETVERAFAPS